MSALIWHEEEGQGCKRGRGVGGGRRAGDAYVEVIKHEEGSGGMWRGWRCLLGQAGTKVFK
jgi:hypothetical protein